MITASTTFQLRREQLESELKNEGPIPSALAADAVDSGRGVTILHGCLTDLKKQSCIPRRCSCRLCVCVLGFVYPGAKHATDCASMPLTVSVHVEERAVFVCAKKPSDFQHARAITANHAHVN